MLDSRRAFVVAVSLVAASLLFVAAGSAAAKSYYFPEIEIDVTVRPDGRFEFHERRTFAFDGDFSWAFYKVERARTAGGAWVDVSDFVIGESGRAYELGDKGALERSKRPGSYSVSREGDFVVARWYYHADDERRTFDISYTVHDAVTVHDDYAQLYWQFIGDGWDVSTSRVSGTIHLPPGADKDNVRAWLHTTLTSEYWIEDAQTVGFRVDNLRPNKFVEMRILIPPALVPNASVRVSGAVWDRVFAEESRWVEEANRARLAARRVVEASRTDARAAEPRNVARDARIRVSGHTSVWVPSQINDGVYLSAYNGWLEFESEQPWVEVDLGAECLLHQIVLSPAVNPGANVSRAEDFSVGSMVVWASNDGFRDDVRRIGHYSHPQRGATSVLADDWIITLPLGAMGRQVRLSEMSALREGYVGVGELEIWAIPVPGAADYSNRLVDVYVAHASAPSVDVAALVARRVADGIAARGVEEVVVRFSTKLAGKLGGLFLTFLTELPNVGISTDLQLGVIAGGDYVTGSADLAPRGDPGRSHADILPVMVVSPGDCFDTGTTLRLERSVGTFGWRTEWEEELLSYDEQLRLLEGEHVIQFAVPFAIVLREPVRISERGSYRLTVSSWCSGHEETMVLSF